MSDKVATFYVYKKSTAVAIKIMPMNSTEDNDFPDAGGYMFTFAKSIGDNTKRYSWKKAEGSISFMLAASEVTTFIAKMKAGEGSIYHDPGKGSNTEGQNAKALSFSSKDGTVFMNMSAGKENKISIVLTPTEIASIEIMLSTSLKDCYGW